MSLEQARFLALHAQGLTDASAFGLGKPGVLRAVEHLGYVQIDTISVVERAHHHVLWTRVPDYRPAWLDELQTKDTKIFEYWSHAASYLPFRDFRYCLPRMRACASGKKHWFARDKRAMRMVLDRVRAEGPLAARDFEAPAGVKSGPWFDWKPAKTALEQLFIEGTLMVRGRKGFQKIYDLAERVLPAGVDTTVPTPKEMARFLITSVLRAHGLALEPEMRYLRKGAQATVRAVLKELVHSGEVAEISVAQRDGLGFHVLPHVLEAALASFERAPQTRLRTFHVMSPFDNSVIQRRRVQNIFGFDYQIECYVPAPKRKYGYFCLPLLADGQFIGRLDCKAERKERNLRVYTISLEPGIRRFDVSEPAFQQAITRFAAFNGCSTLLFPPKFVR
ncbi:MAG: YcaQ family DNA glycosylase [Deltaproteobacteria bacterium]|nr:YcaQ family DNA glycosylase [Deltaproteobacteria bacterium]